MDRESERGVLPNTEQTPRENKYNPKGNNKEEEEDSPVNDHLCHRHNRRREVDRVVFSPFEVEGVDCFIHARHEDFIVNDSKRRRQSLQLDWSTSKFSLLDGIDTSITTCDNHSIVDIVSSNCGNKHRCVWDFDRVHDPCTGGLHEHHFIRFGTENNKVHSSGTWQTLVHSSYTGNRRLWEGEVAVAGVWREGKE